MLKPEMAESILSLLYGGRPLLDPGSNSLYPARALSFEYALAQMWLSWGIRPAAVMGHSLGEYVAACVSGVFTLADGLKLIAERGRLMQSSECRGAMIAVSANEAQAAPFIASYCSSVSVAAFNGPGNLVLSGPADEVAEIENDLKSTGIFVQRLQVRTAFHSPLVDPILDAFEKAAQRISYAPARLPLVSNVTGRFIGSGEILNAPYWRLHLRSAVRFEAGVQALAEKGCNSFLELGPGTTLLGMARKCVPEGNSLWLPSLRSNRNDWEQVLESVATLYARGFSIDWKAFDRDRSRSKVELPNYPFEKSRCWFEEKGSTSHFRDAQSGSTRPVKSDEWRDWLYEVQWVRVEELSTGNATRTPIAAADKWLILARQHRSRPAVGADVDCRRPQRVELIFRPDSTGGASGSGPPLGNPAIVAELCIYGVWTSAMEVI